MKIDAHQHFWKYSPADHAWIDESMEVLKRDFLPEHLKPELNALGFSGCVAVQASQTESETEWLLRLAREHPFIKGVVGWVDLRAIDAEARLRRMAQPKLKGIRHVVQDEPDDNFLLQPEFLRGIVHLAQFGLTYDILIHPRHLPVAVRFVEHFPQQPFVLDHLAKPFIRDGKISPWREHIRELAQFPHVYCKLSGMVTEAAWHAWREADFRPYLDAVFEAFGPSRLMIGSDWPVCLLSADYLRTMSVVSRYLQSYSAAEQACIMGANAATFYRLSD